jgi:uncharacterized membrane protein YoaK (UPF0700 family)
MVGRDDREEGHGYDSDHSSRPDFEQDCAEEEALDSLPSAMPDGEDELSAVKGTRSKSSSPSVQSSQKSFIQKVLDEQVKQESIEVQMRRPSARPSRMASLASFQVPMSPMNPKYSAREHAFIVLVAMLLSFNSGFSNGLSLSGLLAPAGEILYAFQSTSGYTGVYTQSALALASSSFETYQQDGDNVTNVGVFGFQSCMVLSFVSGAAISGVLNPRPSPWRLAPMYAPTFFLGAMFMCVAASLAHVDPYTPDPNRHRFYFFVALANGIQNGVSSMYSANLIRTTHMTGTSTDVGLFIGQLLRRNNTNLWKLKILLGLVASFWTGGFLSLYAVTQWRSRTLLFNAAVFLMVVVLIVVFLVRNLHVPLLSALRGSWHWQRTLQQLSIRDANGGQPQSDEKLLSIFQSMDADGNGYLCFDELYQGLQLLGCTDITRDQVEHMFQVCDRDGDGKISAKEWSDLIRGENVLVG